MGNYFTSNKVNADQHLINTDNKITILVDKTSIILPVSQTDKTNIVTGGADANVSVPDNFDVVDVVYNSDDNKLGGESSEVVEENERTNSDDSEVVEAVERTNFDDNEVVEEDERTNSDDSNKVIEDVEQQGGDSETSVENTTRLDKPKNRRKNKRSKN